MLKPDYVVGLTDGEGSFTVFIRDPDKKSAKIKRRAVAEPKFYLKLIEKDKEILYELQRFFDCGKVYFQKDSRPNHQNCYRYEVVRRSDLEKIIIPFFRRYQLKLNSKRKDFKLFADLLKRIQKGEHLNESGLRKLFNLKRLMH